MSKEIIRSVIDSVLWTCGATKENRELLAEVIAEALAAAPAAQGDAKELTDDEIESLMHKATS